MQDVLNSALQVSFAKPALAVTSLRGGMALPVVIAIGGISSLRPAYRSSDMNSYDAVRGEGQ